MPTSSTENDFESIQPSIYFSHLREVIISRDLGDRTTGGFPATVGHATDMLRKLWEEERRQEERREKQARMAAAGFTEAEPDEVPDGPWKGSLVDLEWTDRHLRCVIRGLDEWKTSTNANSTCHDERGASSERKSFFRRASTFPLRHRGERPSSSSSSRLPRSSATTNLLSRSTL